jgi:hypothetical protein
MIENKNIPAAAHRTSINANSQNRSFEIRLYLSASVFLPATPVFFPGCPAGIAIF